jgi:rhodanese-related sulfurtransferase
MEQIFIGTRRRSFVKDALWQGAAIILLAVVIALGVNYFRQGGLPLLGGRAPASTGPQTSAEWAEPTISLEEARALFYTDGAVFIDARPEELYRSGHIRGAIDLPPEALDRPLPDSVARLPQDSLIIVYCDGEECPLSKEAAMQLSAMGYSNVQVLLNGWTVWKDAGLPTEKQ